ncbi:hypothetical protein BKA93DRAFT_816227 [Sparassis latifolia]
MATAPAPNPRASLLSGLRTGGVRSASGSTANIPHTAVPNGSFAVPRYMPAAQGDLFSYEEEDELSDLTMQNLFIRNQANRMQQPPMTSAVDGGANRFAKQQAMGGMPFNSAAAAQNQLVQLQLMQMELARLQAIQAQQYQAELLAQAQAQLAQSQRQRQAQQPLRRSAVGFVPPATAGPMNGTFDLRSPAPNAQVRRVNQAEQLRARLGVGADEQLPMTAALGGKFGSRIASGRYDSDEDEFSSSRPPSTPNYTTVISGGTSLGNPASNNINYGNTNSTSTTSKSDAAVSWRRGGANNSVLSGNRAASSPLVKITPPPIEPTFPAVSSGKSRPSPLTLSAASLPFSPNVTIDVGDSTDGDESSSMSSKSNSPPSTPQTASSSGDVLPPPLSPREEAVRKLYEGLGIGRPAPNTISITVPQREIPVVVQRVVSLVVRQPRGPPSNNDELLPKNFASRSRRQAIGALVDARERREIVAF